MKKIFSAGLFVSALFCAVNANASENFEYIPYVGIDYGHIDAKTQNIKQHYQIANFNMGTKYNNYFGTEVFYEQTSSDTKKISENNELKTSYRAYGIDVFAYLPIGCYHEFDFFASVGGGEYVFYDKLNKEKHNTKNAFGYRVGVGVMYNVSENVSLRAMSRYVDLNDITEVNHLYEYTIGLRYHFY